MQLCWICGPSHWCQRGLVGSDPPSCTLHHHRLGGSSVIKPCLKEVLKQFVLVILLQCKCNIVYSCPQYCKFSFIIDRSTLTYNFGSTRTFKLKKLFRYCRDVINEQLKQLKQSFLIDKLGSGSMIAAPYPIPRKLKLIKNYKVKYTNPPRKQNCISRSDPDPPGNSQISFLCMYSQLKMGEGYITCITVYQPWFAIYFSMGGKSCKSLLRRCCTHQLPPNQGVTGCWSSHPVGAARDSPLLSPPGSL